MNWSDVTLKQYYEIQDILTLEDDYTILNLIDCLYKVDSQSLPIHQLKGFDISFLKTPIPEVKLQKTYTLNGTVYHSNCDITRVSVAQFIDYQNYCKAKPRLEQLLSVFFFPEGFKDYNTGYDIIKVQEDLLELPVTVAQSIAFFFDRQFKIFFWLFRRCLIRQVRKLEMEKQEKKKLIRNIRSLDLWSLVSFPTSLNIVRSRMNQSQK